MIENERSSRRTRKKAGELQWNAEGEHGGPLRKGNPEAKEGHQYIPQTAGGYGGEG